MGLNGRFAGVGSSSEEEALRGGWPVRQVNRQINSQSYERTLLSKNKAAMLRKGAEPKADDLVMPEEEIKDPLVLEFLGLKDEYSENDMEDALIHDKSATRAAAAESRLATIATGRPCPAPRMPACRSSCTRR